MPKTALRTDADFEAFYDRHWKYVYRLCFTYMKNEADAEDCTEDVFVKVRRVILNLRMKHTKENG